jgi:hypothetical protein
VHRTASGRVELAHTVIQGQLPMPRHHGHRTGQAFFVNFALQNVHQTLQALWAQAHLVRGYRFQGHHINPKTVHGRTNAALPQIQQCYRSVSGIGFILGIRRQPGAAMSAKIGIGHVAFGQAFMTGPVNGG